MNKFVILFLLLAPSFSFGQNNSSFSDDDEQVDLPIESDGSPSPTIEYVVGLGIDKGEDALLQNPKIKRIVNQVKSIHFIGPRKEYIKVKRGKITTIYDLEMNVVLDDIKDFVSEIYNDNLCGIYNDSITNLVSLKTGKILQNSILISEQVNGFLFSMRREGRARKFGLLDSLGREIFPLEFDHVIKHEKSSIVVFRKKGENNEIIDVCFDTKLGKEVDVEEIVYESFPNGFTITRSLNRRNFYLKKDNEKILFEDEWITRYELRDDNYIIFHTQKGKKCVKITEEGMNYLEKDGQAILPSGNSKVFYYGDSIKVLLNSKLKRINTPIVPRVVRCYDNRFGCVIVDKSNNAYIVWNDGSTKKISGILKREDQRFFLFKEKGFFQLYRKGEKSIKFYGDKIDWNTTNEDKKWIKGLDKDGSSIMYYDNQLFELGKGVELKSYHDGYFIIEKDNQYGVLDEISKELIIQPDYGLIEYKEGFFELYKMGVIGSKFGLYNHKSNVHLPPVFNIVDIYHQKYIVSGNNTIGLKPSLYKIME